MPQVLLVKAERFIEKYRLTHSFLLIFLFFQPFTHFSGIKNTAFVTLLLLFIMKLLNGQVRVDLKDRTVQALCLLVGVAILSSLLSPYPFESLNSIRKNLLYQVVVFLVIINEYRRMDELKPILSTMAASFAVLTITILLKNDMSVLLRGSEYPDGKESFLRGYSLHATFYIPLIVGYLYAAKDNLKIKGFLLLMLVPELVVIFLSNRRAPVIAIVVSVVLVSVLAKRFKPFFVMTVMAALIAITAYQTRPKLFLRYKTLIDMNTYVTNEGLSGRFDEWKGTWDMIKDRPILGYGYGWKKIATVIREGGFLEAWKEKETDVYNHFNGLSYGKANPHNLLLQILFEVGFVGFLAFIFFWSTVFLKAISMFRRNQGEGANFLKYGTIGILFAYVLVNITNGLWEEIAGNLMMTLAAVSLVLYKEAERDAI